MILLFIVFAPLLAAALIMAGAPARKTALWSSGLTLVAAFAAFLGFHRGQKGFSYVTTFPISDEWNR